MVTGGLGGLGLRVASLLSTSAGALLLVSRSGAVARGGQGSEAVLASLRSQRSCAVRTARCDVSQAEEARLSLRLAEAGVPAESAPPSPERSPPLVPSTSPSPSPTPSPAPPRRLAGTVHMTEVLSDRLLRGMAAAEMSAVFAPKALGAAHLRRGCDGRRLRCMLCFSSQARGPPRANAACLNACCTIHRHV